MRKYLLTCAMYVLCRVKNTVAVIKSVGTCHCKYAVFCK